MLNESNKNTEREHKQIARSENRRSALKTQQGVRRARAQDAGIVSEARGARAKLVLNESNEHVRARNKRSESNLLQIETNERVEQDHTARRRGAVGNSPGMPGIPSSGGEALADPELEVFLASED